ncbi:aminotransferase class I/II-fold pyridoxal phosphate-dependent enzyme [Deferribacter autotrophicus]|uniref:Aminotransferase class I/II-fold pyridoxal phosphate-dependent enzyme n=1 Tax=Deferribacter autotrophicus TaxID=500465 RepID=A0A5A8F4U7_9BACT|nr:aminotransferase class I/II-fold pyridoxal phosphate-dependent enzyme [Deferribacter autotrophicus]KAA0259007.1 aminotransferase class I/II-fold pyridoxal phosphate-dependent enzyme [Deferribacter autotrophicus]
MNPLAQELNEMIAKDNASVLEMLSKLGKNLFMPKGILTQSAEAKEKAHKFNATIGIATENNGPMYLDCIYEPLNTFEPKDLFPYAPATGKPELRKAWKEKMVKENPSLQGKYIGLPIVTNALTHGLSIVADLFVDEGDYVVTPDKFWGNYRLTFSVRRGGEIATFDTFTKEGKFNVNGLIEKVKECGEARGKVIILLNFPNNPSGYMPTVEEAEAIANGLVKLADEGIKIIAVTDDAYFGLFYEDSIKESIFGLLANKSENLLAIKLDGATKEEYVWGFRVGFITFAATTNEPQEGMLTALEKKVAGLIRGTISNCPHPSQTFVLRAINHPDFAKQKAEKYEIMKARALKVKEVLDSGKYVDEFEYYPFNSGYFMCLKLKNVEAEALRVHLLDKYGVGTISVNKTDLRIAFSCIEVEQVEELFDIIYQGCKDLNK